jgi:hypothetical protein
VNTYVSDSDVDNFGLPVEKKVESIEKNEKRSTFFVMTWSG